MTNDTSLESYCALLLESAKIEFFIAKSSYVIKMFTEKICPKNEKLYIFEKPLTKPFQICKKFCKILNNLILKFFSQKLCNSFPYVKGFPKS